MGNCLSFSKKSSVLSKQEIIEMGKTAQRERDRLLKERPELKEFQKEIDRRLNNAGDSENRMAVLGIMMESKLKDLRDQLSYLSSLMQQKKVSAYNAVEQKNVA